MVKKAVLLGPKGQLGVDIVKAFQNSKIELTGLTRRDFDADTDDPFKKLSKYKNHHYLINCIAYHKTDQCEANPGQSFKINSSLPLALSRFCSENQITLIHISSDYVFDGYKREPYTETDLPSPLNVYGTSKLAGEWFVKAYADKYYILRMSSLFGSKPSDDPKVNFVEKMVYNAREGRPLKVIDDQVMSPTHAQDAALAIRSLIENDVTEYGLYHCCNSGECSWFEFAQKILELTGLRNELSPISYSEFHSKVRRPQFCSMDNSRLGRYYHMKPWTTALEDYLKLKGCLQK